MIPAVVLQAGVGMLGGIVKQILDSRDPEAIKRHQTGAEVDHWWDLSVSLWTKKNRVQALKRKGRTVPAALLESILRVRGEIEEVETKMVMRGTDVEALRVRFAKEIDGIASI